MKSTCLHCHCLRWHFDVVFFVVVVFFFVEPNDNEEEKLDDNDKISVCQAGANLGLTDHNDDDHGDDDHDEEELDDNDKISVCQAGAHLGLTASPGLEMHCNANTFTQHHHHHHQHHHHHHNQQRMTFITPRQLAGLYPQCSLASYRTLACVGGYYQTHRIYIRWKRNKSLIMYSVELGYWAEWKSKN